MIYNEKSSFWGYPCFRKPPYILLYVGDYNPGTGNPFLIRIKWNDTSGFSQQCSIDTVICREFWLRIWDDPKKGPGLLFWENGPFCDAPATPVGWKISRAACDLTGFCCVSRVTLPWWMVTLLGSWGSMGWSSTNPRLVLAMLLHCYTLHMPLHVHWFNNTLVLSHYWLNKLKHVRGRKRHWS